MSATGSVFSYVGRDSGATLLEMLVVMTLAVVTAGLVFPSLRRPYQAVLTDAVRSSIMSDLRATRVAAIHDGEAAAFEVSPDGRAYSYAGRTVSLPGRVWLDAEPHIVVFEPGGSTDGARIEVVQDHGRRLPIAVSPLGVIEAVPAQ